METNIEELELIFRDATLSDIAEIEAIEREAFSDPWSANAFSETIEREEMEFVVCTDGKSILGYFVLGSALDEGELMTIAVRPGYRGYGIGHKLIDELKIRAKARGLAVIFLEVRVSNEPARALYRSVGFIQVGVRREFYRFPTEDAIVGRLEL